MKLFKVDTKAWTVRSVDGTPYPGTDSDGDACFENTHFEDESKAWACLQAQVNAAIEMAGRDVAEARKRLAVVERESADVVVAAAHVAKQLADRSVPK